MADIINISEWRQPRKVLKSDIDILSEKLYSTLITTLYESNVDIEQANVAFDVATVHYLSKGLAHRAFGEHHASILLLDKIHSIVSEKSNVGYSL